MVVTRGPRAILPVLALVALCVTACGSQASSAGTAGGPSGPSSGGSSSGGSSAPAGAKACATVWQKGATLPKAYHGCVQQTLFVKPDVLPCSSGQRIIRYADQYYAVPGGTIHAATKPLDHDRHYLAVAYSCRG